MLLPILLPPLASLPQFTMYAIAIINLLIVLWGVAIWIFAVKHARNIPMRDALSTVAGSIVVGWLLIWGLAYTLSDIVN